MAKIELIDIHKHFTTSPPKPGLLTKLGEWLQPSSAPAARDTDRPFVIDKLNLHIPDGLTLVILGPSGCGKSTLLRIIAGLLPPDGGMVRYDGVDMKDTPPGERRIGMVFQHYALYPHLTARENILSYFLLRERTLETETLAEQKLKRTSELLGVEIRHLLNRKPPDLSGGEKQRVALGRCITREPALFLLDEPFASLDLPLRRKYRAQLKTLLREFAITTVFVTHDQEEALLFADRIAIMNAGRIEQTGTAEDIYHRPVNRFVAEFLNLDASTVAINWIDGALLDRELAGSFVGVRPEDIVIYPEQRSDTLIGRVLDMTPLPLQDRTRLRLEVAGHHLDACVSQGSRLSMNGSVWVHFNRYHVFESHGRIVTNC